MRGRPHPRPHSLLLALLLTLATGLVPAFAGAEETAAPASTAQPALHERIDLAIAAGGLPPELCSDADFVRRIYLDLVGMIPTTAETRAFLEDPAPDKRQKLIDQLLADVRFPRRMADLFDSMLMERRADKHVKSPEWEKYLYESFAAGKPLNELCHEILSADGADPKNRAPARFYLDREVDVDLLTRDVGRIFFGKDLQCAQCHDHPVIADYYQTDYYGIYAFLQRSVLYTDKKNKISMLGEKAEGEANYQSVFIPSSKGTMPPMLPSGAPMQEPKIAKDAAYVTKPGKDVRPVAKFSLRELLAKESTTGENLAFNRNFANRLWAMMMGRGLVEPVDLHHADNPPTHPELLEDLSRSLAEMKFDVRAFLRELVLSRTYQRNLELPADLDARVAAAAAQLKTLAAEKAKQEAALKPLADQLSTAETAQEAEQAKIEPLSETLTKAKQEIEAATKPAEEANKALAEIKKKAAAQDEIFQAVSAASTQTAAAVAKLPEDAELKGAAAKFAERSQQLKAEHDALAKQVADLQKAASQATEKLTAAKNTATTTEQQLTAAKQNLLTARTNTQQALAAYQASKVKVDQAEQLMLAAQRVSELGTQITAGSVLHQKLAKAQAELAAAQQTLKSLESELPGVQAAEQAATAAVQTATTQLTELQKQAEAKQAQLAEVAAALKAANEAKAKLPKDEAVVSAAAMIQASHNQLTAALAETNKQVAAGEQAVQTAQAESQAAAAKTAAMREQQKAATEQIAAQQQAIETHRAELATAESTAQLARQELIDYWSQRFVIGTLQPLTAQQMTWSILQVTGQVQQQLDAAAAELDKKQPLDEGAKKDPAKVAQRERAVYELAYSKLQPHSNTFVNLFAAAPGQPQDQFFATVDQALFFGNGTVVSTWISGSGELLSRLDQAADPGALASELYLSVLSREPSPAEVEEVKKYLEQRGAERQPALQELVWALLTSAEFRFNH